MGWSEEEPGDRFYRLRGGLPPENLDALPDLARFLELNTEPALLLGPMESGPRFPRRFNGPGPGRMWPGRTLPCCREAGYRRPCPRPGESTASDGNESSAQCGQSGGQDSCDYLEPYGKVEKISSLARYISNQNLTRPCDGYLRLIIEQHKVSRAGRRGISALASNDHTAD